jgi:ankyrin repeat protein
VTALLKLGADPKIQDNNGKRAIDYARSNKYLINTATLRELEEISP